MKRQLACLAFLSVVILVPTCEAQAPATTIISDTVYRADSTAAGGTLLISWPAFATANGKAVAAGHKSVTIGAGGAVNVSLVPNEGATPSGTYYRVVYKLDDGATSEELWSVPDVPTTTIAAVRSTIVPQGVAIQVASRQYVDTQINAVTGSRFHNVRYCDQFGGTDAGAKIAACIADLPSSGGTADARGLEGAQTISSDVFSAVTKPVRLVLGAATYSMNVSVVMPANITLEISQGGSLSIATGTTTTIRGALIASLTKIFTLNGTGLVSFTGNGTIRELYPQWWGAAGDGPATDDTAAIQAAIAALPAVVSNFGHSDFTQSNPVACVVLPSPSSYYKTTAPLNITKSGTCLRGANGPVRVENATSGANVINVDAGSDTILFGVRIEDLQLKGAGNSSRALYLDQVWRSDFRIWANSHPGTCLYAESTGTQTGAHFNHYKIDCESNQNAVIGIYSKGGRSNVYEVRTRENEVGIKLENENGSVLRDSYIESNNGGTAKVGAQFVDSLAGGAAAGSGSPRFINTIENTYFENNTNFSVDADAGNRVILHNIRADGGWATNPGTLQRQIRLDGGGEIDGLWATGIRVSSAQGIVRARNAWGLYGLHSQLRIEGLNEFPLPYSTSGNTATKSWFDTDPAWTNLGSPDAPTLSFDSGTAFFGSGSKKAVFPSTASNFADSRTRMDNVTTSVTAGDWLSVYAALKFGTGAKAMSLALRNNGGASETIHDFNFITDSTDWIVFALQGKVPSGVTSAALFLNAVGADLGSNLDTWTGGVAIAKNAYPVMYNTEWAARGVHDVDLQHLRVRSAVVNNSLVIGNGSGNSFLESAETAGSPACNAGDFRIWASSTGNKWKKCENGTISDLDTGGAGSGDNLSLNGSAATDADFDDATPAAPGDGVNVRWQKDAGTPNNISANLQFATASLPGAVSAAAQSLAGEKTFVLANSGTADKSALIAIADSQTSSGTRANLIGFESTAKQTTAGGVVTNAYGVMIRSAVESAGTITNAYGLRIEPQTVGTGAGNFDVDSGPAASSFTANLQGLYINTAAATFKLKDPSLSKNTALNGTLQMGNVSGSLYGYGMYGAAESTHPSGTMFQVNAIGGDAYHSGAGTVDDLQGGLAEAFVLSGAGNVTRATGLQTFASMAGSNTVSDMIGLRAATNARSSGTVTNNYGIKIENQAGVGSNNYALFTGTGRVRLGDDVDFVADNTDDVGASGANRPRSIYAGTSLVTPTVNATTALQTNGTTRISSTGAVNNVSLDAEGTGNSLTTVSKIFIDGAGCQNTTASSNWDLPTSAAPTAACRTGTNTQQATLDFATDSGALTAQRKFRLPSDWAAGSNIDAIVTWSTSATTNDVVWQIAIACASDGDSDDPGFTDDAFTADAAKGTANQLNDTAVNTVTTTGSCAAGDIAFMRIKRDPAHASDTLAAGTTARLIGVELAIRRTQ